MLPASRWICMIRSAKADVRCRRIRQIATFSVLVLLINLGLSACRSEQRSDEAPPVAQGDTAEVEHRDSISLSSSAGPVFACERPVHDFGEFWVDRNPLTHTFEISNKGTEALKLVGIKMACGCTKSKDYTREIQPGETGVIPVSLHAHNLRRSFSKKITLTLNDPSHPTAELFLKGAPKHYVEIDPPSVNFGRVSENLPLKESVSLVNRTEAPLHLELIQESDPALWGRFQPRLVETMAGKTFEVIVEGTPPYGPDINRGTFRLKTNIPQLPIMTIQATADHHPRIRIEPQTLRFTQPNAEEQTRPVRFTNIGPTSAKLLAAEVDNPEVSTTLQTLEEGRRYQVQLTFPAGYLPSEEGDQLLLRSDDAEMSETVVPIVRRPSKDDLLHGADLADSGL